MKTKRPGAVKAFLRITEFAREIGLSTGAVSHWIRTGQVLTVEVETFGKDGAKKRKRIKGSEVGRVRKNLDLGLPVGHGLNAAS